MYNYYTYKKKEEDEIKKKMREKKSSKEKIIHKIKTNNLSSKYNKRIIKFIFGLVNEPIVIKDFVNPIENTRKLLFKGKDTKHFNFSFKNYVPDKERIVYNSYNKYLE